MRVPSLFQADQLRNSGNTVFVDSYYDKLVSKYMGMQGMEWLIPSSDPYFGVIRQMAELDWKYLPDADCVVSFRVDRDAWQERLNKRNRQLDADSQVSNTFDTQELFLDAAEKYCTSRGISHVVFDNTSKGVDTAASQLIERLKCTRIL